MACGKHVWVHFGLQTVQNHGPVGECLSPDPRLGLALWQSLCPSSVVLQTVQVLKSWGETVGLAWRLNARGPGGLTPLHLLAVLGDSWQLALALTGEGSQAR